MRKAAAKSRTGARRPLLGKLAVFGVGLIGGSLALALKKDKAVAHVVGVGRSRANLLAARRLGLIDEIGKDAAAAVKGADVVVLAAPLGQTAGILAEIAPHLPSHTVITDAGSTKQDVIAHARAHLGDAFARFVPAHPIAGTEKSGARAAFATLYRGRNLILTPQAQADPRAVQLVVRMWRRVGMRVFTMTAPEHDRVFALVSHLPHLVAYALMHQIAGYGDAATLFRHTGGGFRDTVRIAGSSTEMWRDICIANRDALLPALDDYVRDLTAFRGMIAAGDGNALAERFGVAREARAKWLKP